ncbi:MAG: PD-(D/E)XK nuclease family protein [Synechococcales cyanobacterium K44_A2020_017]|jgi:putative RecB family exonuclease|uniref:RecB family exonuclease n=1 Tax=Leptolyngbya sp. CCY15150 TaxID=2767772 RepID=UPI00194E782A|nr:PD-(D/E)XK nuclease family protein [Leptolyngbya sp. CCY15150]MBF2090515.1 PD-(D/E)XK nuclease family protein [Synechococcales cyanobacterium K32_A2020_035]MBF2094843.1 PD-(D/E)XK nuclease family protein [Synechococcales cyanobacterium K44_A2020_017]
MTYPLSAAKLQCYDRCPKSYYFRYERKLPGTAFFGSAALGTSLHQALAQIYRDWHYQDALPALEWIEHCWNQQSNGLSSKQLEEGRGILRRYYHEFIMAEAAMRRPLAVEGRIQGTLQVENLEFSLSGRYDRIDYLDDGLELIDYKSTKDVNLSESDELDLQIGLYYLALEQHYQRSLKQLSLIYLRTGDKVSFEVTPFHRERVTALISELALELRHDRRWQPFAGEQCDRCAYAKYCSAACACPEPLPDTAKPEPQLQLVLGL